MDCINLVPSAYRKLLKRKKYINLGVTGLALSIIGLMFLASLPRSHINIQQKEQAILEQLLNQNDLQEVKSLIQTIKESNTEKTNIQTALDQIDTSSYITRTTMDIIVDSRPEGLVINEVIMERAEDIISIRGQGVDIQSIAAYIRGLSNTFKNMTYTTYRNESGKTKQWIDYYLEIKLSPFVEEGQEEIL